ncbi:Mannosyltransferase ALG2 like protein [Aduncisulcus paluster]|uniref:Alpha-1,3/1,6-mannosyltransferase ALG2 n=1 Tax=Aduncisulcus paluster TaxID=2918883 RepID=A0ABQ5K2X7_9EUKA|nr:Mannosyltransferase ALG2 like protein [Aduncisulcus paluster]
MPIGGSEKLVLDTCLALQKKGHSCTIFCTEYDPKKAFDELKSNQVQWFKYDAYFVDLCSACVPILRLTRKPVLFYCHFPDKLLRDTGRGKSLHKKRGGFIDRGYRLIMDKIEYFGMKTASCIVANSQYTKGVIHKTFPSLPLSKISVIYPPVNMPPKPTEILHHIPKEPDSFIDYEHKKDLWETSSFILSSINRIVPEKRHDVSIHALRYVKDHSHDIYSSSVLIIGGGCKPDNIEEFHRLQGLAKTLDVDSHVIFAPNFSDSDKSAIFSRTTCGLYPPRYEHFGIVPIEFMSQEICVVCDATGGPCESVGADKRGGLLVSTVVGESVAVSGQKFGRAVLSVLEMKDSEREHMGIEGKKRVDEHFGMDLYGSNILLLLEQKMSHVEVDLRKDYDAVDSTE